MLSKKLYCSRKPLHRLRVLRLGKVQLDLREDVDYRSCRRIIGQDKSYLTTIGQERRARESGFLIEGKIEGDSRNSGETD